MTTSAKSTPSTSFIDRAEALYPSNPLKAAVMLTAGVKELLAAHGLPMEPPTVQQNGLLMYPGKQHRKTLPERNLDLARRSLAQTQQDAQAGIAPHDEAWELDIDIARSTVKLVEKIHG